LSAGDVPGAPGLPSTRIAVGDVSLFIASVMQLPGVSRTAVTLACAARVATSKRYSYFVICAVASPSGPGSSSPPPQPINRQTNSSLRMAVAYHGL
jgi:hypothetical protein